MDDRTPNHAYIPRGIAIAEGAAEKHARYERLPEAVQQSLLLLKESKDPNYRAIRALLLGEAVPSAGIIAEDAPSIGDESYGIFTVGVERRFAEQAGYGVSALPEAGIERRIEGTPITALYAAIAQISRPPVNRRPEQKIHEQYWPVLRERYGFPENPGGEPRKTKTLKEVGEYMRLSTERVRVIEFQAIYCLRKIMLTEEERAALREE